MASLPDRRIPSPVRALVAALCLTAGCTRPQPTPQASGGPKGQSAAEAPGAKGPSPFAFDKPVRRPDAPPVEQASCPRFEDVHEARRLEHVYDNGEKGGSLMVEAIGGGVGWLDYDADGAADLYANQGGDPAALDRTGQPVDRLFRQVPPRAGEPKGSFVDVTDAAGLRETGYGQGVAVGDYDGDGFDDVYVTNVGENTLFHNRGDGTFAEVTASAGVADARWSSSAAWADLDVDGDLDLYLCNYVQYDPLHPLDCRDVKGRARICHPRDVEHWPDECFENLGDGSFRAVSREWGLFGPGNKALGVAVADFTGDGLPDVYVANDTTPNFLFVNRGAGATPRFEEQAMVLGCAVDRNGMAQASMGLAVGDYDGNGWLDVYSTHFYDESNTLYRNLGAAGFEDVTGTVGLHEPTLPRLGFGTVMADLDQDGRQELVVANGHVENYVGNPLLKMKPQLFSWTGARFHDCSPAAGAWFENRLVGRGLAAADYDADGDLDLAVACQNTPTALLENTSDRGHWLSLRFVGARSNRRAIGTRVILHADGRSQMAEVCGGTSYASTHQPLLAFGLGKGSGPCRLEIRWPGGMVETREGVAVDQALVLREPEAP